MDNTTTQNTKSTADEYGRSRTEFTNSITELLARNLEYAVSMPDDYSDDDSTYESAGKLSEEILNIISNRIKRLEKFSPEILKNQFLKERNLFTCEREIIYKQIKTLDVTAASLLIQLSSLPVYRKPAKKPEFSDFVSETIASWILIFGLLIVFHCIIWVLKLMVDISWNTWGWVTTMFWIALTITPFIIFVGYLKHQPKIKEWEEENANYEYYTKISSYLNNSINDIEKEKKRLQAYLDRLTQLSTSVLHSLYTTNLALPIRSLKGWDYKNAKATFWKLFQLRKDAAASTSPDERIQKSLQFYDTKLSIFYTRSLPSETEAGIYKPFKSLKANQYRSNFTPKEAMLSRINHLTTETDNFVNIDTVIDDFNELVNTDTSGFFLDHDSKKVEQKTKSLQKSYNDFAETVQLFSIHAQDVNHSLGLARAVAYRNIYLGAELINIVRENGGGGSLTSMDDKIADLSIATVKVGGITDFSTKDALKDIMTSAADTMLGSINNILNDKASRKYAKKNPKEALAVAAGAAVISGINAAMEAWEKRNQKIADCLKIQEKVVTQMDSLVETYLDSEAKVYRALELTESLVKVNNGFMKIYEGLHNKIFINHQPQSVTMTELQQLVLAIKDYKSISDTKL